MKTTSSLCGITGPIGSGKSTALRIFKELNIPTLSADEYVRVLYETNQELQKKIIEFCPQAYEKDVFQQKALKEWAFFHKDRIEMLNKTIHPFFYEYLSQWKNINQAPLKIVEIPLLFESQAQKFVDKIITVYRPTPLRFQTLALTRHYTPEIFNFFNDLQISHKPSTLSHSHYIIPNSENIFSLRKRIMFHVEHFLIPSSCGA